MGTRFGLPLRDTRRLIAAGTAAGFAAAYNTSFAAALFVLEVVTGIMVLNTSVPVLVATAIAVETTRLAVGTGPIYGQRAFALTTPLELLAFAALVLLGALAAQAFMRVLTWGERHFHASGLALPWRPALGGLMAGAVAAFVPKVAGNGYEPPISKSSTRRQADRGVMHNVPRAASDSSEPGFLARSPRRRPCRHSPRERPRGRCAPSTGRPPRARSRSSRWGGRSGSAAR